MTVGGLLSLSLTGNAKLSQSGQSASQEVSGLIPTEGTFFTETIFLFPM